MITALVGAQWGDEGKGKVIDIMASKADVVVRATGGNNAGHTVVSGGKTYKLHLVPSGILYEGTVCCVGPGCVVDPLSMLKEMAEVEANGTDLKNLRIDYRAHIVMPYHLVIDELSEKSKGAGDIGTTKKGIGTKGKPNITFKADMGFSQLPRNLDIMNASEFAQYRNDYAYFGNDANHTHRI